MSSRATLLAGLPSLSIPPKQIPRQEHSAAGGEIQNISEVCLFTDGSGDPSELPALTLTAWSVVAWVPPCSSVPMDWGPLPGQEHSIVRAEAFALLRPFDCPCPCKVFCDNAAVCANFRHLLSTPFLPHLVNYNFLTTSELSFTSRCAPIFASQLPTHPGG